MSAPTAPTGATPTCSSCGRPMRPVGGPGEVTHGTVAGVAIGPVGWTCPVAADAATHDVRRPTVGEATDAVRDAVDVARRTAFRGTLRCGVCDTPFVLPGRRTTRTVTITGDAPAVTITLDVPVLRCTEDAVDNLPPEAFDDVLAVVATLLDPSPSPAADSGGRT